MIGKIISFLTQSSKSRTIVVNTLIVLVGVADYLSGNSIISQNPDVVAALASAVAGINVILRFLTVEPVSEKKSMF